MKTFTSPGSEPITLNFPSALNRYGSSSVRTDGAFEQFFEPMANEGNDLRKLTTRLLRLMLPMICVAMSGVEPSVLGWTHQYSDLTAYRRERSTKP